MKNPPLTTVVADTKSSEVRTPVDVDGQIRDRAFELYQQRGREGGHALEDWLQAEAEVLQNKPKDSAA